MRPVARCVYCGRMREPGDKEEEREGARTRDQGGAASGESLVEEATAKGQPLEDTLLESVGLSESDFHEVRESLEESVSDAEALFS